MRYVVVQTDPLKVSGPYPSRLTAENHVMYRDGEPLGTVVALDGDPDADRPANFDQLLCERDLTAATVEPSPSAHDGNASVYVRTPGLPPVRLSSDDPMVLSDLSLAASLAASRLRERKAGRIPDVAGQGRLGS